MNSGKLVRFPGGIPIKFPEESLEDLEEFLKHFGGILERILGGIITRIPGGMLGKIPEVMLGRIQRGVLEGVFENIFR